VQADTVVPNGVQGYDRYAYANNSPAVYGDPSGHFTCSNDRNSDDYCPGHSGPGSGGGGGGGGDGKDNGSDDYSTLGLADNEYDSYGDVVFSLIPRLPGDAVSSDAPVNILDYIIAIFDLKRYLETNFGFRAIEYKIWRLPPDASSVLTSVPAATGMRQDDQRGLLLTHLLLSNNFPETIDQVNINTIVTGSFGNVVASRREMIYPSLTSGSQVDLMKQPVFVPTESRNLSVAIEIIMFTSDYTGTITHVVP
jgi:hypothetical protein